jgi:hypothetical protein
VLERRLRLPSSSFSAANESTARVSLSATATRTPVAAPRRTSAEDAKASGINVPRVRIATVRERGTCCRSAHLGRSRLVSLQRFTSGSVLENWRPTIEAEIARDDPARRFLVGSAASSGFETWQRPVAHRRSGGSPSGRKRVT